MPQPVAAPFFNASSWQQPPPGRPSLPPKQPHHPLPSTTPYHSNTAICKISKANLHNTDSMKKPHTRCIAIVNNHRLSGPSSFKNPRPTA